MRVLFQTLANLHHNLPLFKWFIIQHLTSTTQERKEKKIDIKVFKRNKNEAIKLIVSIHKINSNSYESLPVGSLSCLVEFTLRGYL